MKMPELKERCRELGLAIGGTKKDLMKRFQEYCEKQASRRTATTAEAPLPAQRLDSTEEQFSPAEVGCLGRSQPRKSVSSCQASGSIMPEQPPTDSPSFSKRGSEALETPPSKGTTAVPISGEKKRKVLDLDAEDDDTNIAQRLAQAEQQAALYKKKYEDQQKTHEEEKIKLSEKVLDGILQRNANFDALVVTMFSALGRATVATPSTSVPIKAEPVVIDDDEEWEQRTSRASGKPYWTRGGQSTWTQPPGWVPPPGSKP